MKWKKNVLEEEKKYQDFHFFTDTKSMISEQLRMLRTNIEFMSIEDKISSLVITSPSPGDGKTTIAINLAAVFASQNKRVILVDTDMRKPRVHIFFELNYRKGLSALFVQKNLSVTELIHKTSIENLFVLPCGVVPPNPAEMLSSDKMNQIMAELENKFDLVIYDTPPINIVADAQIMAGKVDGTIFVLRKNHDKKADIKKAKKLADAAQARVLGAVFNRESTKENVRTYYYHYQDKSGQS